MPFLRKNNKIKSIHSTLAIEANTLSFNEVKDVIEGKIVIGSQNEIQEVKNAYLAYNKLKDFDGFKESDLLEAHKILTNLLCEDSGEYRNHGEGVFDGEKVIFVAPSEQMVPSLMKDLFEWLHHDNEIPLLIKSCIFHYEFVFIHPFSDGNGRVARLWQNVLLCKWNPLFEYIPIESQIQKYQRVYYNTIALCHASGNSDAFIEFMLEAIDETLGNPLDTVEKESKHNFEQVNQLLDVMENDKPYSANELMIRLEIKTKETLRSAYLNPAIENGLVKMTLPDKPNSKNQKYIKY